MLQLQLKTGQPLQLLCLGAHSDDIEIGCGGTLLRLLQEHPGSSVTWVVFAADAARKQEAQNSARDYLESVASADVRLHQFRESYFPVSSAQIKDEFEALKSLVKPDLIFSHRSEDLHQDHRTVAELTWNTFRNHLILQYEIPKYEGDLGTPNVFVRLPGSIADRKVELLVRHFPSQAHRTWFHPDTFYGLMTLRGVECNAPERRAEAFYARKLAI